VAGFHPKKILVPVDFSDLSLAAVDRALEIAGSDTAVELLHVLSDLLAMEPGNLFGRITNDPRIEAAMERFRETFSDAKYASLHFHVEIGNPGHEITSLAKRENFDLIIIPSHGYGPVKHVLLGSVAERVVCLASCPVLVLRS
jgi:nucleotide-binding universal stress UspA family protein